MKRFGATAGWGLFAFLAGVFLLLKGLKVFGEWGELIWGLLYAVAGLGFLVWLLFDRQRWWRAVGGFTLLGIGALLILPTRGIQFGVWSPSIFLFGLALGFWVTPLVRTEHWWAIIPAGVLTVLGVALGLWSRLSEVGRLNLLLVGVGLVFFLLSLIRFGQTDTRWAAIPAGALLLLGLVTLLGTATLPAFVAAWWPVLLIVGGLGLLLVSLAFSKPPRPAAMPRESLADLDAPLPAAGASVEAAVPPVADPIKALPPASPPASPEKAIDIYDLLKQQPD